MELNIQPNHRTGGEYCVFEHNKQHYYASRCIAPFYGLETMIFHADRYGNVSDWTDLYCDRSGKSLKACINEFIQSI